MFKKETHKRSVDLETGVTGFQLLLQRKLQRGEELTAVERHLLRNLGGLRNNLFAPSIPAVCLQLAAALLIPLFVVTAVVTGGKAGVHYLVTDAATLAQEKEDREVRLAIERAEQGLAADSEFSFHNSSLRRSVFKDGDLYRTALVNFVQGLISTYQPKRTDSRELATEIVAVSERENIDPFYVAAIIASESSFSPKARSRVGALGLMQLMPATAREVAKRSGKNQSSLSHPRTNIELGVEYIKTLERQFGGNRHFALAAYNWGPANVKRVNKQQSSIPTSVEGYSRKVLEKTLRWQRRFQTIEAEMEAAMLKDKPVQEARAELSDLG